MESGFQGLAFPAGFLLPPAATLTPVSVFTPGNVPGEPVTPHWVLDGGLWLKVTLEEPVSICNTGSQPLCPPQMQCDSFSGVLRTKLLYP